jgi:FMN phosphatase YigB (HAD superfamily)
MRKHLYLICILFVAPSLISHNIIFDFNGVLMGTNTLASLKQIGLGTIVRCMIHLKKSPHAINIHLKSKFFEILHSISDDHALNQYLNLAYDEDGNQLPYLMRAWLNGSMTCTEIRKYAEYSIAHHPEWFDHKTEKQAILNLINTIFTPQDFVQTRTIHSQCLSFIKACKKQGHKIFALSNWDKESFTLLQKKYPHVFNLFDGIIISGEVNTLKPSYDIYMLLLNHYNLEPHTCWFIDDQQENVIAASQLGIHGIICHQTKKKKPDFARVARTIKEIISNQPSHVSSQTAMESMLI